MSDFSSLSDLKFLQFGLEALLQPWDVWRPAGKSWILGLWDPCFGGTLRPHPFSSLGVISSTCLTNWYLSL